MTSAFILTLDHGSDTDLLSIADDLKSIIEKDENFIVIDVKPWSSPQPLETALPFLTPPGVPGQ